MFFYKKLYILLTVLCLWLLSGCSKEAVSLEEALLSAEAGAVLESEAFPGNREGFYSDFKGNNLTDAEGAEAAIVYVYICGEVEKPGVYALPAGSRIVAAVEAAGGFKPEALKEAVNLAKLVQDGSQIIVPDVTARESFTQETIRQERGRVNLNSATAQELCTLNGIGEARARAIIAYREEIGGFRSVEQLKEVSGIGDSLFNQISNSIYIE